jgi:hypothetical protein
MSPTKGWIPHFDDFCGAEDDGARTMTSKERFVTTRVCSAEPGFEGGQHCSSADDSDNLDLYVVFMWLAASCRSSDRIMKYAIISFIFFGFGVSSSPDLLFPSDPLPSTVQNVG